MALTAPFISLPKDSSRSRKKQTITIRVFLIAKASEGPGYRGVVSARSIQRIEGLSNPDKLREWLAGVASESNGFYAHIYERDAAEKDAIWQHLKW